MYFMEKTKGIIIKTIVLLINAGLVVGGVFLIKNQQDKTNENQTSDVPVPSENTNNKSISKERVTVSNDDKKEEAPSVLNNDTPVTPAIVNSTSTSAPTATIKSVPVPTAKKTTKTS